MLKIFLAIPSHSCEIKAPTALAIMQAMDEAAALGVKIERRCLGGDADLARVRNVLLGNFLASDATHFWQVDADVSWHQGAFTRLLSHRQDFVCGLYRMRSDEHVRYPVHWTEPKALKHDEASGEPLLAAEMVAGGFWLLSRACVEKVANATERWVTGGDPTYKDLRYPFVFDFTWVGNERRSEDYTFCARWRELGGDIWVDPFIRLDHTGPKVFEGNLVHHLAQETKAFAEQMRPMTTLERGKAILKAAEA